MKILTAQTPEIEGIKHPQNDLCQIELFAYPFPVESLTVLGNRTPHNVVRWTYLRRKYLLERILGGLLLLLAAPLIAVLWTIVRLHSKGGGFFQQTRVGYRGEHFEILKLRTMIIDAEADGKAKWCAKGDPRMLTQELGRQRATREPLHRVLVSLMHPCLTSSPPLISFFARRTLMSYRSCSMS